jgi:alpha-D-xyloside xylohydrolase
MASVMNPWVPYTISGGAALPADGVCPVSLLGGGNRAKICARPLGDATTFYSEVGDAIDHYFFHVPTTGEITAGCRLATGEAPLSLDSQTSIKI